MVRMRRGFLRAAAMLALAVGASACSGSTEAVPVPTPIAAATIIENYSGTLFAAGSNLHTFAVTQNGEMKVTLTAISTIAVDADPNANPPVAAIPSAPVTIPMTL